MVSLVPLTTEDGGVLEKVHATCFPDAWDHITFNQLMKENLTCGWMATSFEGIPLGFILARTLGEEAEILTFAVCPSSQRKGIGRCLLNKLKAYLKSAGCAKIFLEVAVDNEAAIALYTTEGFVTVGSRPNYYKRTNQTFVCASIMRWTSS